MKPASTTRSGSPASTARRARRRSRVARREARDGRRRAVAMPCAARDREAAAPRRVAIRHASPRRRCRPPSRGVEQRGQVRAAARDEDGDPRERHARRSSLREGAAKRAHTTIVARASPGRRRATIVPIRIARSPRRVERPIARARHRCAATTTTMPMPQLNTRCISSSATLPCALQPVEDRRPRPARALDARLQARRAACAARSRRSPPPVMCAMPLTGTSRISAQHAASRRCASARAARRRACVAVERRSRRSARASVDDAGGSANSRSNAGRSTRGRAPRRPAAIERPSMMRVLLDDADAKPARSYSPAAYMPGISAVSPPISAQPACSQPAAMPLITAAATSTSSLPHGEVVEEEQRLGALHEDVVDAHRDEVDADRVVAVERERELELGADAVGAGDEHRLAVALADLDQRAEAADAGEHLGAQRALGERLDALDQRVAGVDVDAGVAIGKRGVGTVGGGIGGGQSARRAPARLSERSAARYSAASLCAPILPEMTEPDPPTDPAAAQSRRRSSSTVAEPASGAPPAAQAARRRAHYAVDRRRGARHRRSGCTAWDRC